MKKVKRFTSQILVFLLLLSNFSNNSYAIDALSVTNQRSADQLIEALVGTGITISNATFTGNPEANGTFSGGESIIGFDSGIILSTGKTVDVIGPNNTSSISTKWNTPGDADLNATGSGTTNDAAILEFDFVPNQDTINFQYVLSSDEYEEFM